MPKTRLSDPNSHALITVPYTQEPQLGTTEQTSSQLSWLSAWRQDLPRLVEACRQAPVTDPCLHHLGVIPILENRMCEPASHELRVGLRGNSQCRH